MNTQTGTELKTYDVVEQVEKMAELARIGQDFLEASAYLSYTTTQAMINDILSGGRAHLLSRWPSHMFGNNEQ